MNRIGKLAVIAALVCSYMVGTDPRWAHEVASLLQLSRLDASGEQYVLVTDAMIMCAPYVAIWAAAGIIILVAGRVNTGGADRKGSIGGVRFRGPGLSTRSH